MLDMAQAEKLLAGCVSGAITILSTYPLEVLRTRMALAGGTASMGQMTRQIWKEHGPKGYYQVHASSLLGRRQEQPLWTLQACFCILHICGASQILAVFAVGILYLSCEEFVAQIKAAWEVLCQSQASPGLYNDSLVADSTTCAPYVAEEV